MSLSGLAAAIRVESCVHVVSRLLVSSLPSCTHGRAERGARPHCEGVRELCCACGAYAPTSFHYRFIIGKNGENPVKFERSIYGGFCLATQ